MKVLLIDAGSNRKELNEPIGIESIAGKLLNSIKDINIDFRWLQVESIDIDSIKNKYDLIGISAKLGTLDTLKSLLESLIEERKKRKIIIGGPISTFGYFELLNKYDDVICVRGEGESAFLNICKLFESNSLLNLENFTRIPNLAFKLDQKLIETERVIENLEVLPRPYRYYLNDVINKNGIVRIESSRGCSWSKCDFCSVREHYGSNNWRPFPIGFIVDELKSLSKEGCLSPYFTDEDFFGGNYERSRILAQAIIKEKNSNGINEKMNFFFSARINDLLHKEGVELLKLWKEAGLRELFVGLESGVKGQLKRYGKLATPERNSKAIRILKDLDIQLDTGYILFDPEMKFDELIENINYIEKEQISQHDSRSLKKLRAQPFTKTTKNYFLNKIIDSESKLNLDLLYYDLKYNDSNISRVMSIYDEWEAKLLQNVYSIQTASRGEIISENYRKYLKEQLSIIREIDFKVLKKIVAFVSNEIGYDELINFELEKEEQKKSLLNSLICIK